MLIMIGEETATVTNALVTGLTSVASDIQGTITSVLPVALGVVGAVMVITFGVKFFKKIIGR